MLLFKRGKTYITGYTAFLRADDKIYLPLNKKY